MIAHDGEVTKYKYYLANNTEDAIKNISRILHEKAQCGYSIKVRLHPRYSDESVIKKYFSEYEIEYPDAVSIHESICTAEYVIGSYTTVLLQAYIAGKKVVLDDVAYSDRFGQLKNMRYIMNEKETIKFSEIS